MVVEHLSNILVCAEVLLVDKGCKAAGAVVSQKRAWL